MITKADKIMSKVDGEILLSIWTRGATANCSRAKPDLVSVRWGTGPIRYRAFGRTKTANFLLSTSTRKTEGSREASEQGERRHKVMGISIKGRWPSAEADSSEFIDLFCSPQEDIGYQTTRCLPSSCAPTWHAAWMAVSQPPSWCLPDTFTALRLSSMQ